MAKIKVIHLITSLGAGGAEKVVLDLITYQDREKFEVQVVSLGKNVDLLENYRKTGINVEVLGILSSLTGFVGAFIFLLRKCRNENIQILHAHLVHSAILAGFVRLFAFKTKVIFTSHTINLEGKIREFLIWLFKRFRSADILFSKEMIQYFNCSNIVFLPNGIATEEYKIDNPKFEKFTFIAIGRLEPVKNQIRLIKAGQQLKKKIGDKFQIFIVGKGSQQEFLEKEIIRYKCGDVVKLLGFRKDIVELCNQSHAFVLPSHWEGFPISLLEAGASGLPVISTPVGSIPSIIDEATGYLSSKEDFDKTMLKVYHEYDNATATGLNLQKRIEDDYHVKVITSKLETLYQKVA